MVCSAEHGVYAGCKTIRSWHTKTLDVWHYFLPYSPFHQEHQLTTTVCCTDYPFWVKVPCKATWFFSLQVVKNKVIHSRNWKDVCKIIKGLTSFFLASVSGSSVDFLFGADFSLMFF